MGWLILLVLVLLILFRVTSVDAAAEVSRAEFLQCLAHSEDPAIVHVRHRVLWLLGAARNRYILVFHGLRIHSVSFRPIDLPPDVVVIETSKL